MVSRVKPQKNATISSTPTFHQRHPANSHSQQAAKSASRASETDSLISGKSQRAIGSLRLKVRIPARAMTRSQGRQVAPAKQPEEGLACDDPYIGAREFVEEGHGERADADEEMDTPQGSARRPDGTRRYPASRTAWRLGSAGGGDNPK